LYGVVKAIFGEMDTNMTIGRALFGYTRCVDMRRVLAITLLIALFAPALAPSLSALTADPEANLPACCRSHGAHHCAMMHWMLESQNAKPRFTPAPCPMYPGAASVSSFASFTIADAPTLRVERVRVATLPAATARRVQLLLARTRRDRGPPAPLA